MEHLPNGFTLELAGSAFPLSTDSMVLAHFAKLPRNARVLDLGSGCGTLGLLLCAKDESCTVTGVELTETAHQGALRNICRNHLTGRMESICTDLRQVPTLFSPGSFSCCISNPPYFSGGPASLTAPTARREDQCTLADLMYSVSWALKYGGDFFLVHRPERLAEIIARAAENKLEAKRLLMVRHHPQANISIIVLQFRKGAKPGLKLEEHVLYTADNTPSAFYREVYHL